MTKMFIRRPFHEFKLPNQFRTNPAAVLHLFGRQAQTPAPGSLFRQVRKRTFPGCQFTETVVQLLSQYRGKSVAGSTRIKELCAFVISEDNRIEALGADRVAADDKLLPLVDPHLAPGA